MKMYLGWCQMCYLLCVLLNYVAVLDYIGVVVQAALGL